MKRRGGDLDRANTGRALQDRSAVPAAGDDIYRERLGIRRLVSGAAGPLGRIPAAGGDPGIPGRNGREIGDPAGRAEPADGGDQGAFGSPERGARRQVLSFEEIAFEVSAQGQYLLLCEWLLDFERTLGRSATVTDFTMRSVDEGRQVGLTLKVALYRPLPAAGGGK